MKEQLINILVDSVEVKVDMKKIVHGLLDEVLEEALQDLVAKTETTFDDQALALFYPLLETQLKSFLDKKIVELEAALKKKLEEIKG